MVYHVDVHMPDAVYVSAASILCRLGGQYTMTRHALQRQVEKGIEIPAKIPVADCTIVEVTALASVEKMLIRFPYGGKDVVMGLTREGKVTTIYTNEWDDTHSTLDTSKYEAAP